MAAGLDWEREGRDWPHREVSRFVVAAGMRWHVQRLARAAAPGTPAAAAPVALLLHGTGASTHSWRALMPLLAAPFDVIALDLPGHAFTAAPPAGALSRHYTLPGMAAAVADVMRLMGAAPGLIVGHSAGAAVAVRMALDGHAAPAGIVSLNGAFQPLPGLAAHVFSPVAKLAAVLPFGPALFAKRAADPAMLARLVAGTGSTLDAEGVAFYARLAGHAGHVGGALGMMANWDLRPLAQDLKRLVVPLALMVGSADRTISPEQAQWVHQLLPATSKVTAFAGLGHLAHEEQPARVANAIVAFARQIGLLPDA